MSAQKEIATPVLSATVLVVRDDPFEVLMLKRPGSHMFAAAMVFPGGVVEESDAASAWKAHVRGGDALDDAARAIRIAACRETYEETGILLAPGAPQDAAPRERPFIDVVRSGGAQLDLDALYPFGHWITPEAAPKRFDVHFFLCRAPDGAVAVADGGETFELEWVRPLDALAREKAGALRVLFPTLMNIKRLAESNSVERALNATRAQPVFTVRPIMSRRDGQTIITIPEAAGYGVTEYASPPMPGARPGGE